MCLCEKRKLSERKYKIININIINEKSYEKNDVLWHYVSIIAISKLW